MDIQHKNNKFSLYYHKYLLLRNSSNNIQNRNINGENSFLVYPKIRTKEDLSNIINRLNFAFAYGKVKKNKIYLYIDSSLKNISFSELKVPNYQADYLKDFSLFEFITDNVITDKLETVKKILLFDGMEVFKSYIGEFAYKVIMLDPKFYSTVETENLRRILWNNLDAKEKTKYKEKSLKRYANLLEKNKGKNEAYCFASGPSFDNFRNYNINNEGFKIICNSIVKNKEFLNYINGADLLVFADPVFHFSMNKYAEVFRQDVIKYIQNFPSYIVIPDYTQPLLEALYPELESYLIGMPVNYDNYNFPGRLEKHFGVKGTANILTLFMLPIASSISNKIFVIGVDGRQKKETYFWKHSKTAQYHDKMKYAFKVHPSFFRDRNYEGYYEQHLEILESLLQFGENNGKEYICLHDTFIPSFQKRNINEVIKKKFVRKERLAITKRRLRNLIKKIYVACQLIIKKLKNKILY